MQGKKILFTSASKYRKHDEVKSQKKCLSHQSQISMIEHVYIYKITTTTVLI